MSVGLQFISAVIAGSKEASLLEHGDIAHMFKGAEPEVYSFVRSFLHDYGKLPTPETVTNHTGVTLLAAPEPPAYYFDLMDARHVELTLKKVGKDMQDLLKPGFQKPHDALNTVSSAVIELMSIKYRQQVVDFRAMGDAVIKAYKQASPLSGGMLGSGLHFGWPTLDAMTGGAVPGDVISIVGRPAAGKTWQMLYAAHHGWAKAHGKEPEEGQNPSRMFVSMEMGTLPIASRLAAMHTHIDAGKIKTGTLKTSIAKKLYASLYELPGYEYPFWIVDGNLAATIEDIWLMARQLKPGAIFIDGGYLVKHPTERDRYRRVAENAELMKKELAPIAPTVVSWQFAKTASKKKKDEKVGLEDIGYTDAIAQVSSLVLGVLQPETVETVFERIIDILKGRNGEVGQFKTRWNFQNMDFSEATEVAVNDLQFV